MSQQVGKRCPPSARAGEIQRGGPLENVFVILEYASEATGARIFLESFEANRASAGGEAPLTLSHRGMKLEEHEGGFLSLESFRSRQ